MILERLAVEGFRHIAARYEFAANERLTIIAAPNGTGKSTLLDALYSGLLERHTVSGRGAVERFESRGRSLTPRVEIDFRCDGRRYRIIKQFLEAKQSHLMRWEGQRFVPLHDGVAADDFVRSLFYAEPALKGIADPNAHWGLANALWAPSGAPFGALPAAATDRIRALLGGVTSATPAERAVEEHVVRFHARYFTSKGALTDAVGSAKLPALEAALVAAQSAAADAHARLRAVDELRAAHTARTARAVDIEAQRAHARAAIEDVKGAAAAYDELAKLRDRCATSETHSRQQFTDLERRVATIARLRADGVAIAIQCASLRAERARLGEIAVASAEQRRVARAAFERATAKRCAHQAGAGAVTAAESYRVDSRNLEVVAGDIAFVVQLDRKMTQLVAQRSGTLAPSAAELLAVREALGDRRVLEATIRAGALALELRPLGAVTLTIVDGDRPGPLTIAAGSTEIITARDEIVVDILGFGQICARGSDSTADARTKLATTVDRIDATFKRFGSTSIVELEARTQAAEELDRKITKLQQSRSERLGKVTLPKLRAEAVVLRRRLGAIEAAYPQWQSFAPDTRALRSAFDANLERLSAIEKKAQVCAANLELGYARITTEIETQREAERRLELSDQQRLVTLQSLEADGRDSDDARDAALKRFALGWAADKAALAQCEERLTAYADDPRKQLARFERDERSLGDAYTAAVAAAEGARALLDDLAGRGTYRVWVEAEELSAELEGRLRVEEAEAAAIQLLRRSFDAVRSERIGAVVIPLELRATEYLGRISGSALGSIKLTDQLTPLGVVDASCDAVALIEGTLSAGEIEQIYLATRLALAGVIAADRGRQLFILDDALQATDPARFRRFVALIDELSREQLQVIVTTPDPARYAGIAGAKHLDLRAALAPEHAA